MFSHQLTCLQQHLSPVQVLHLVAVVLCVRGAGACGPGLGPVHFSESFGVELQRVHLALPGELQHYPAGHHVPAAEHRRTVHLRRVEDDVKLFQLVENHLSFAGCATPLQSKCAIPLSSYPAVCEESAEVGLRAADEFPALVFV